MTPLSPEKHSTPLAFFLATNRREVKWLLLVSICYSFAVTSITAGIYYAGHAVDLLQQTPPGNVRWSLIMVILGTVGYEVGFRLGHVFEVLTSARMRRNAKQALFDHITGLSYGYFADRFSGQIAHKVSATTDALEQMTSVIINDFIENGVIIIVGAAGLALVSPYLGLYQLIWGILFAIGTIPFARRMNKSANEYAERESKTSGIFVDFFTNIAAVKVYGRAGDRDAVYMQLEEERKAYKSLGLRGVIAYNYMGISIIVLATGVVIISTLLYEHMLLTVGGIVIISGILLRMYGATWELGVGTIQFIRQRGEAQQNLKDLIVAPTVLDGSGSARKAHEDVEVEYHDVTFAYGDKRPVLQHFSLTVPAGEKLGIVGLSGAGKTTFANLLLRFFDVQDGSVLLNGADVRTLSQAYLRSHISYISQDTSLFHTTIKENIGYGMKDVSSEQIQEAARLAYADDFIAMLPEGYDSVVGERGIKLSGGQRQRIAIARAILANRPLFLLDEATSALDSDSEDKIQKGLITLMEGKTVIAIAHRLSTLSHMNRIIYLENGAIAEDGTHDELLAQGGKYAKLWHMQAGGFLPS